MTRITRIQKNTVFGFGEGEAERVFLRHLRGLYASGRTSVKIDAAGGKDLSYILEKAVRVRGGIPYNHSFLLIDTDREWVTHLKIKAKKKGIELIGSSPCLEGLLLSILEPGINYGSRLSGDCKKRFQDTYLQADRMITDVDCKRLFSNTILNRAKTNIQPLRRIIEIMEGNF